MLEEMQFTEVFNNVANILLKLKAVAQLYT